MFSYGGIFHIENGYRKLCHLCIIKDKTVVQESIGNEINRNRNKGRNYRMQGMHWSKKIKDCIWRYKNKGKRAAWKEMDKKRTADVIIKDISKIMIQERKWSAKWKWIGRNKQKWGRRKVLKYTKHGRRSEREKDNREKKTLLVF